MVLLINMRSPGGGRARDQIFSLPTKVVKSSLDKSCVCLQVVVAFRLAKMPQVSVSNSSPAAVPVAHEADYPGVVHARVYCVPK